MISSVIALLASAVAVSTDGSAAAPPTTTPAATVPAAKPYDPGAKVVCRTILPTGSRLGGTRVCQTQAEWAETTRNAQEMTTRTQARGFEAGAKGN